MKRAAAAEPGTRRLRLGEGGHSKEVAVQKIVAGAVTILALVASSTATQAAAWCAYYDPYTYNLIAGSERSSSAALRSAAMLPLGARRTTAREIQTRGAAVGSLASRLPHKKSPAQRRGLGKFLLSR